MYSLWNWKWWNSLWNYRLTIVKTNTWLAPDLIRTRIPYLSRRITTKPWTQIFAPNLRDQQVHQLTLQYQGRRQATIFDAVCDCPLLSLLSIHAYIGLIEAQCPVSGLVFGSKWCQKWSNVVVHCRYARLWTMNFPTSCHIVLRSLLNHPFPNQISNILVCERLPRSSCLSKRTEGAEREMENIQERRNDIKAIDTGWYTIDARVGALHSEHLLIAIDTELSSLTRLTALLTNSWVLPIWMLQGCPAPSSHHLLVILTLCPSMCSAKELCVSTDWHLQHRIRRLVTVHEIAYHIFAPWCPPLHIWN